MIYIEPNEILSGLYDDIPHEICNHLEEWTGADLMITISGFPVNTKSLVELHIKNGAILVQRKSGMDLISSFGNRLNTSIERMRNAGAYQTQCALLFIGTIKENVDGKAVIDEYTSDYTLTNVMGAIEAWIERGGVFSIIETGKLKHWLTIKENHLKQYAKEKIKYIYQEPSMQGIQSVNDWRITVSTFPMMGVVKTQALRKALLKEFYQPDLITALIWITDSRYAHKIEGIGSETIKACREWLGLPDNWYLDITYEGDKNE